MPAHADARLRSARKEHGSPYPRARFALAALFLANGFLMGAWAPQIPLLLSRHDTSETVIGGMILLLGLGAITAMSLAGRWLARFGSVPVSIAFSILQLPMLPLVVAAPNLWLLAPAMMLFGALIGSMDVAMNANAVEVERRLGRAIMSSSHGFWSLGGFLGGSLGSWLIVATSPGWQALLAAAVATVLVFVARPYLRGEPPTAATRASDAGSNPVKTHMPREIGIWILGVMALCSMMPEGAVLDWAAIYLGQEHQASPFMAGLGFAFFSGMMAIMRFAGDGIRNRFGAVRTVQASGLIGAFGMMLAALAPAPEWAILGFALSGLGLANMVPVMFSAAGNFPGHAAGAAISVVTMVGYTGILVAPASIGWIAEHLGFRPTYTALALLLLAVVAQAKRCAIADHGGSNGH